MQQTKQIGDDTFDNEISVLDTHNPHSLVNMVPVGLKEKIRELPPKFFNAGVEKMNEWCKPTQVDNQLRLAFWAEYSTALEQGRKIKSLNIYSPVCSSDYFYRNIVGNPNKLAWLIFPPQEYMIKMEEMLHVGLDRMREVLMLPIRDRKGNPNTKLISEWVKIVALLDNRVKGAVTQSLNINQKSLNVNVDASKNRHRDVEDIEKELREVETQIRALSGPVKQELLNEPIDEIGDGEAAEVISVTAEAVGAEEAGVDS